MLTLLAHFSTGRAGAGSAGVLAHNGAGDAVGFAFGWVVDFTNGEAGLDEPGAEKGLDRLIAGVVAEIG